MGGVGSGSTDGIDDGTEGGGDGGRFARAFFTESAVRTDVGHLDVEILCR